MTVPVVDRTGHYDHIGPFQLCVEVLQTRSHSVSMTILAVFLCTISISTVFTIVVTLCQCLGLSWIYTI